MFANDFGKTIIASIKQDNRGVVLPYPGLSYQNHIQSQNIMFFFLNRYSRHHVSFILSHQNRRIVQFELFILLLHMI